MGHARKTDLPHPQATGLTMAICGFATLALAAVLCLSLASRATAVPGGDDGPVTIVTRPPATDAAVIAGATPFDVVSCSTTVASRR